MNRRRIGLAVCLLALLVSPDALGQALHKDERFGFQVRCPTRWEQLPVVGPAVLRGCSRCPSARITDA